MNNQDNNQKTGIDQDIMLSAEYESKDEKLTEEQTLVESIGHDA